MKDTQKKKLLAVIGVSEIPFVAAGIAADTSGHVVSEDGMTKIAEALEATDTAVATATALLQTQLDTANAAKKKVEDELAAAKTTIAAKDTEIKTLNEKVEDLENDGSVEHTSKEADEARKNKEAFHLSDKDPFNQMADGLVGKPKAKKEAAK